MPAQAPGRWRVTGGLVTARDDHTATLLPNGQVLVAGGGYDGLSKRGTIRSGDWGVDGDRQHGHCTRDHTATLLPNGQVLVAGGIAATPLATLASAELYDPATGMWTATGSMATARDVAHGDVAAEWAGAGGRRRR